jgi:hypothetical protein
MAENKKVRARRMASFEDDVVFRIVRLREELRNLGTTKIKTDLRNMSHADHPVFTTWAADEMSRLARLQRDLSVALHVSDVQDPGFSKRVLKRVQRVEALLAENPSVSSSATQSKPTTT